MIWEKVTGDGSGGPAENWQTYFQIDAHGNQDRLNIYTAAQRLAAEHGVPRVNNTDRSGLFPKQTTRVR